MPKFTVVFEREVIAIEQVTREIEAADDHHAHALAEITAEEFDRSCPEDLQQVRTEIPGWYVEDVLDV